MLIRVEIKHSYVYKLCFGVEDICRPAIHKAWIPCEPQHHQQNEETQNVNFSKGHGPQQTMLLTDHIIGSNLLFCLHCSTAPCLLKTESITWETRPLCHLYTQSHSQCGKSFLMLIQVSVTIIRL